MKNAIFGISLFLLIVSALGLSSEIHLIHAYPRTVYVDDDNIAGPWDGTQEHPYWNITSAITYASSGDAIFVFNGTYREHLTINESVSLSGQNVHGTIIHGNQRENVINIVADKVNISKFTIQGSDQTSELSDISISSQGNNVSHNIVKDNYYGIHLFFSTNNSLSNNSVYDNYIGISLSGSNRNNITESNVSSNEGVGIRISDSSNIIVSGNNLTENGFGVVLVGSDNCTFVNNNVSLNINDGLYVFVSHNNVFSNNSASSNAESGMRVGQSTDNFVNNNVFSNEKFGVLLQNSTANVIATNNFLANSQYGIRLDYSNSNSILGNTLLENVVRTTLLFYSNNNTILHNTFNNSARTVWSVDSTNNMDNGVEGNYWSDYNGTDQDQDSIGDSPYRVDQNNQDNYPLMGAFTDFTLTYEGSTRHVFTICNVTITGFQFDPAPRMLTFNVTSNNNAGFCRTDISEQLINSPYTVLVNEEVANTTTLPASDTSRTLLYFTFNNTQRIRILSKPYYELLDKYNALQVSYDQLSRNSNETAKTLNTTQYDLQELTVTYDELWNNYSSLRDLYRSLSETHEKIESEYAGTRTILIYVAAATMVTIIIAVMSLSFTIRYHRKSEEQAKAIVKYKSEMERISLMNSARADFEADVQRRREKIEDFQRKYSIAIRPRATLEDTIRSLELKKKKGDEQAAMH